MMDDPPPARTLSTFDAVAIIAGIVVGAGIFRLPSVVAGHVEHGPTIIAVWIAGGLISVIGALCFAELATAHPNRGGEYHFLRRAYGPACGFMFAWARVTVIQTGSIALLAFILGDYAARLAPMGSYGPSLYAGVAVVALTGLNIAGVRQTRSVQRLLFVAMLVGLACVIAAGLIGGQATVAPRAAGDGGPTAAGVGLAMVFVLLTYGGWNEGAYISAEVRGGRRPMVVALLASIALITALYLAVNLAYLHVLGAGGVAASEAVAAEVMGVVAGDPGALFISVLIALVVLASMNATVLTGARTTFALGRDFPPLARLGRWNPHTGAPVPALLVQGAMTLGLVLLGALNRSGIETAVEYLSPVFWFFFLLTGAAVFVLRHREPNAVRPFRVPAYPLTPALFCATSAYLLYSSLSYTGTGALAGVAVLAVGLPVFAWARQSGHRVPGQDERADHEPMDD